MFGLGGRMGKGGSGRESVNGKMKRIGKEEGNAPSSTVLKLEARIFTAE